MAATYHDMKVRPIPNRESTSRNYVRKSDAKGRTNAAYDATGTDQKVELIIGDRLVPVDPITDPHNLTFTVANPPSGAPVYMRLRVDGLDSLLVADYGASVPALDPSQGIDLP